MINHDLVDFIYQKTDCEFLSEMKQPRMHHMVVQAILKLNVSDYTLPQWEYALAYIFGEDVQFSADSDVLAYLKQRMQPSPVSDSHESRKAS